MPLSFDPTDLAAAPAVEISLIVPTENDPHHYLKIYFPTPADDLIRADLAPLDAMAPVVLRLPRTRDLENRDGLFYQLAADCNAGAIANEVARCLRDDCQLNVRCYSANAQRRWPQASPWPVAGSPEPPIGNSDAPDRGAAILQVLSRLEHRLDTLELYFECQHLTATDLARQLLDLLCRDPWPEAEICQLTNLIDCYPPKTEADAADIRQLRSLVATAGENLAAELANWLQVDLGAPTRPIQ